MHNEASTSEIQHFEESIINDLETVQKKGKTLNVCFNIYIRFKVVIIYIINTF